MLNHDEFYYEEDGVLTPDELELMHGMSGEAWGEYQERMMEEYLNEQQTEE